MKNLSFFLSTITICVCFSEAYWYPPIDECPDWYKPCRPTIAEINCDEESDLSTIYGHLMNRTYSEAAKILVRRTISHIIKIDLLYRNKTNNNLRSLIENHLPRGNLKDLLVGFIQLPAQFINDDHRELKLSARADVEKYLDTIGVLSKKGLEELHYTGTYGREFTSTLLEPFHGDLYRFLYHIVQGERPEGKKSKLSKKNISSEIDWLKKAVSVSGVDVNMLKGTISRNHDLDLRVIYQAYENEFGRSYLAELTQNEPILNTDPLLRRAVISMFKITENRLVYFAERLHGVFLDAGAFHNYITLNRIFITRREIDLGDIKNTFQKIYNQSLANMIKERITNSQNKDYVTALLWLLNETGNQFTQFGFRRRN